MELDSGVERCNCLYRVFCLVIRRHPGSTPRPSSAASDVYKGQSGACFARSLISRFDGERANQTVNHHCIPRTISNKR